MNWVTLGKSAQIPAGAGKAAWFEGRAIALFKLNDQQVFALDNQDPACGASVLARGLICELDQELYVASPVYKHHYRLRDGQCLEDENLKIEVFPARCLAGEVQVQRQQPEKLSGRLTG